MHAFHHLRLAAVREGERIVIRGNIPQLGQWGDGAHVPMTQDVNNESLWVAELVLPFLMDERPVLGIFQFKYALETATGQVLEEGQENRTVKQLQGQFYHGFRCNYQAARLKGCFTPTARDITVGTSTTLLGYW